MNDGTLLIATRFVKGVSAGFTGPAAQSIITTSFTEGTARNKALGAFAATGGAGFSFGLVLSGLLTEIGWRWVFVFPVPVALIALLAAVRLVPSDGGPERAGSRFDVLGAVGVTGSMMLLVFTFAKAPDVGWGSARTLGSLAGAAILMAIVVGHEARTQNPLIRLGILRSSLLVRANLGALALLAPGLAFSSSRRSTCSSYEAGRRSRQAWRSSRRAFRSACSAQPWMRRAGPSSGHSWSRTPLSSTGSRTASRDRYQCSG